MVHPTDCPYHSGMETENKKLCALLEERKELMNVRLAQIEREVDLARSDMERRLEEMKQVREQLRHDLKMETEKLESKLAPLVVKASLREGASKWSDYIITAIVAAGVVLIMKLLHL